jgi:CHRD domain
MSSRFLTAVISAAALGLSLNASAAIVEFLVPLQGSQEVDGSGDPDGMGLAHLFINDVGPTIDWSITVENIALPPTGAHIHQGVAGTNGPVVVDFSGQLSGTGLMDADLANVLANPTGFYVNIHNSNFIGGAVRGQLGAPVPVPPALLLFLTAFAGVALRRSRRC